MDSTNPYQPPETHGGPLPHAGGAPSRWPLRLVLLGQLLLLAVAAAFYGQSVPYAIVRATESVVLLALGVSLWLTPLFVLGMAWSARVRGFQLAAVLLIQAFLTLATFLAVLPAVQ